MAVTTYNDNAAGVAPGWIGYFGTTVDPTQRRGMQFGSRWAGVITGTDARMKCSAVASLAYQISVDGGAYVGQSPTANYIQLFTGLSDGPHTVEVRILGSAGGSNTYFFRTGTLEVTGAAPDVGPWTAKYGPYFRLSDTTQQSKFLNSNWVQLFQGAIYDGPETCTQYGGVHGGQIIFKGRGTKILAWCVPNKQFAVAVDGVRVTSPSLTNVSSSNQGDWYEIASGLDGNAEHEYTVTVGFGTVVAGLMMTGGSSPSVLGTSVATRKKIGWIGDSITYGSYGITEADADCYRVCETNGWIAYKLAVAGETTATATGLMSARFTPTQTSTQTSGLPLDLFACVFAHSVNDSASGFAAVYSSYFDAAVAAAPAACKLIFRQPVPNVTSSGSTYWTRSQDIATVVAGKALAKASVLNTTTWSGITTADGLHPDSPGYLTLANYETAPMATLVADALTSGTPSVSSVTTTVVNLTSTASTGGVGTLTYQWRRNGSPISGATTLTYSDTGRTPGTAYTYTLVTTDSSGTPQTVTSSPVVGTTTAAPTLVVSPTTATAVDASTTVSITPTRTGGSGSLAATVSGGGTISTATPTSGVAFTYTPPTTGSGTATVTVTSPADSLTAICTITYAPAPTLVVSPTTATATSGGSAVSITPTRTGGSGALAASVSGGGTLSTAVPTSGVAFTWTPPGSGSGTATVTVTSSADSLTATTTITYAPAGSPATGLSVSGPTTAVQGSASTYTFAITPTGGTSSGVTVTPTMTGVAGTWSPTTLALSTATQSLTSSFTPSAGGSGTVSTTNNGGLSNASALSVTVSALATAITLTGPTTGTVGVAGTFTAALSPTGASAGSLTVTPAATTVAGTFSPTSFALSTGTQSATFTFTPSTAATGTIGITNSGGLANPTAISYTAASSGGGTTLTSQDLANIVAALRTAGVRLSSDGLDSVQIGAINGRQALYACTAYAMGNTSGAGTPNVAYAAPGIPGTTAISASLTGGNRNTTFYPAT